MEVCVIGSADMNSERFSAGYLINGTILVDIPEGTCRRLLSLGIVPETVGAVLITHMHGDHILGLPVWALKKTKTTPPPEEGSIKICVNAAEKDALEGIVKNSFSTSFTGEKGKGLCFCCEDRFQLNGFFVTRVPVIHGNLPGCFGYLISDGHAVAGFTGDSCLCDGVRKIAEASDVIFCDCDRIAGNEKHMGIDDLKKLAKEFPRVRIFASHLRDGTREELLRTAPAGVTAADDGMIVTI